MPPQWGSIAFLIKETYLVGYGTVTVSTRLVRRGHVDFVRVASAQCRWLR